MRTFTGKTAGSEEGFVLVLSLVTLLLLTLFGVWALNSADFETKVASYTQQAEQTFQLNEGANYTEGSRVVNSRRPWVLNITDIHTMKVMVPPENSKSPFNSFDPTGNAKADAWKEMKDLAEGGRDDVAALRQDPRYWPWSNLNLDAEYPEGKETGKLHPLDYRYLVTYLNCDKATKGTDASGGRVGVASSFRYRIQASAAGQTGTVESATTTLGPFQCE